MLLLLTKWRLCLNLSQGHIGGHTQRCMDTGDGQLLNQMADAKLLATMSCKT